MPSGKLEEWHLGRTCAMRAMREMREMRMASGSGEATYLVIGRIPCVPGMKLP